MAALKTYSRSLIIAKIMQIIFIVVVLIYVDLSLRIVPDISANMSLDNSILIIITIILAVLGINSLIWGYILPRFTTMNNKRERYYKLMTGIFPKMTRTEIQALSIHILRMAMFISVAILGLLLAYLGDDWRITLPFFVISVVALAITFPTEKQWKKLLDRINDKKGASSGGSNPV